jgi:hypothetical protein
MTKRKTRILPWSTRAQLALTAVRAERVLIVLVDVESCSILGLETARPPRGVGAEALDQVLDQHAHKLIGHGKTLADAIARAELFAAEWAWPLKTPAPTLEQCGCGEIAS